MTGCDLYSMLPPKRPRHEDRVRTVTAQDKSLGWRRLLRRITAILSPIPQALGGFSLLPDPYTIGDPKRGRDLTDGRFVFAGYGIEAPGESPFDLPTQGAAFEEAVHGFGWLDDLAAYATPEAQSCAQIWALDWARRFPRGQGTGWAIDLTARRLLRLSLHAEFLSDGLEDAELRLLIRTMARQASYLKRNWRRAPRGLSRFEALAGLTFGGLCVEGLDGYLAAAQDAMAAECEAWIDAEGGIPSRNPEELLQIFCLLIWTSQALTEAKWAPSDNVTDTIARMAPVLRALRHADGGLARFHGGGRGPDGWLDYGLAQSGVRPMDFDSLAMGFARLAALRTTVVVDAARPPTGPHSTLAHASTLAFELTSGRRPIVVSCGSGASLSTEWQRAGRATQSHSTLAIEGVSSTQFGPSRRAGIRQRETLVGGPRHVETELVESGVGRGIECWHDGYHQSHGLIHSRQMALSANGRFLAGEDTLAAVSDVDKARLVSVQGGPEGLGFSLHFHLHPEVDVITGTDSRAVTLALASGENWVFRHDGHLKLEVEPSLYFDHGKFRPIESKQLILKGRMLNPAAQVNWSLAKADETPQGIRDLVGDEASLTD